MSKKNKSHISYEVKEASASRAIFVAGRGAIPKISIEFVTWDGERVVFELDHLESAKLIEQTMSAYNAIFPPLKTSRGGIGL